MANTLQIKRGVVANIGTLAAGEPFLSTDTDEVFVGDGAANIQLAGKADLVQRLQGVVIDPGTYQSDVGAVVPILPATAAAITIQSIKISCDADPTTELDIDLKWADALIGLANATVVDVCDTTAGVFSVSSGMDDPTIASGKCLYWSFGAAPDAATLWFSWAITYKFD